MKKKARPEEDLLVTFADLVRICRRQRNKIILTTVIFALLGLWYTLSKPVVYTAEATFRDKGKAQANLGKSLSEMFLGGASNGQESEAISLLKSRQLKDKLVRKLNLQADLEEYGNNRASKWKNAWKNLKVQYAYFKGRATPIFENKPPLVTCQLIRYEGEIPLNFDVEFQSDESYLIKSSKGKMVGEGRLEVPFVASNFTMTLACSGKEAIAGRKFHLTLIPLVMMSNNLKKSIKIDTDKNDKALLTMTYKHSDRFKASAFLNELMNVYQDFMQEEHDRHADLQLAYLKKRQTETLQDYALFMQDYADEISEDLQNTGLFDVEKEMAFLLETQRRYQQKINQIDLARNRLETVLVNEEVYFDPSLTDGNATTIAPLFQLLDELKQQSITLNLALQQHPFPQEANDARELLAKQSRELLEVRKKVDEINRVIASLKEGKPVNPSLTILNDPKLLVGSWCQRLQEKRAENQDEWKQDKSSCLAYLENLGRLLEVQERTLGDRLSYESDPKAEFQGISLEASTFLYRDYIAQSNQLESQIREHAFAFKQLGDDDYEVFSLSSILRDSLSQEIIAKSGALAFQLRDQNNRSAKELERIKSELDMQKHFLKVHLEQTLKILQIRYQLLQEKIYALQGATLELVNQKISIIGQHIRQWVVSRLESLEQERFLIEKHLSDLNQRMSKLPKKLVAEQLNKQNLLMNKAVIEEITRLVEGKNITNNLEIIQSSPLDRASVPLLPDSPRIFFFLLMGAGLGAFLSISYFLLKSMIDGIEASVENLRQVEQHVSGSLSLHCQKANSDEVLLDQDLETLRHVLAFTQESTPNVNGRVLLLIEGKGVDYSTYLAKLSAKKGWRTLILPLMFDKVEDATQLPGLLQYLEGSTASPKINEGKYFDTIAAGGVCRFSSELVSADSFKRLLLQLKQEYDLILAVTQCVPCSAEAKVLCGLFDLMAVTITDEKLLNLMFYTQITERFGDKKVTFILSEKEG